MKKEWIVVSPKIMGDTANFYETTFGTRNAGVTFALEMFPRLYAETLSELRGRFSLGELGMILDVMNGHFASPMMAGQSIHLSIYDSFRLYPGMYEEKWNISDPKSMLERLDACSRLELIVIEIWANGFWSQNDSGEKSQGVSDWCGQLL